MNKIVKNNKGITIISLVVTIIISIILAGVSINLILGENGVLTKARNSQKTQDIARISELLELEKGQIGIENDLKASLEGYINQIEKNGILNNKDIVDPENIENGKCYIKMEGKYYYLLEQEGDNVKITYVERPLLLKLVTTQKSNHIDVIANLYNENLEELNSDGAEYEYTIKEEGKEYKETVKTSSKEYTYEGLEQNKKYCIKVKVKKDGQKIEIEKWVVTGVVGTPTIIIENPNIWSASKKVTIKTEEGYRIKYTLDETIPNETNGKIYDGEFIVNNNNTTITARYFDSTGQMGSGATNTVTKIDNLAPIGNITITEVTTNSMKVIVNATEQEETKNSGKSGIKGYYYSKDNGANYTSITTETSYTFTELTQTSNYSIKVKVEDNAGNIEEIDTIGSTDIVPTPTIIVANSDTWTKLKNVTITKANGYTTKYTTDGTMPSASNGTTYSGAFTISDNNTTITAVYLDSTNQIGAGSTNTITKIDKLKPSGTIEAEATTNSIKVTVIATDATATSTDGQSGIKGYYYSKDNGANYTSITTETSYTFTELTQTSDYSIKVKVEDNAGNIEEIDTIGSTDIVPTPTIIVANSDTWTKLKNVTITKANGYTTKYTTDGTMPSASNGTTYSGAFTISDNNTTITAVYLDSTNQIGAGSTNTITKIDKLKPSGTIEAEATTNSIKVTVIATDATATSTDGQSGIKGYYYSKDNGANYTSITTETSYTFTELTQTSDYSIKVKVEDNAGNIEEIDTIGSTDIVPTPTIIVEDASTWTTSKSVTISTLSGYTTKYTTNGTTPTATNGTTYSGAFTVISNCTITATYIDSTNQVGSSATNAITKIDTTAPTKTTINLNGYTSGSWTNANVTITASATDSESGISYYQYSHDGTNVVGTMPNPWTISWDGQWNFYVRAVDNVGNIGEWSDVFTIRRDASGPSKTIITYNSGSNECKWENNINITLSSADAQLSISYYEIDWNGDGVADTTCNSNFIPWNGYSSCNNRFRAVDSLGNRGEWSDSVHIHMDTQAPTKPSINLNGYTSGSWTTENVTIIASSTDYTSGVAYYQYTHDGVNIGYMPNPWTISSDGQWNFYVRAIDNAGNIGEWSDVFTIRKKSKYYLYNYGNEYTNITGGFISSRLGFEGTSSNFTKNSNSLFACANSSNIWGERARWVTAYKINVTNYTTLKCLYKYNSVGKIYSHILCGISNNQQPVWNSQTGRDDYVTATGAPYVDNTNIYEMTLDLSNYSGEYYIFFECNDSSCPGSTGAYCYSIWLE